MRGSSLQAANPRQNTTVLRAQAPTRWARWILARSLTLRCHRLQPHQSRSRAYPLRLRTPATQTQRPRAPESCGNGVLDPGETCDIATASGMPGACPSGCSGGHDCTRYALEGSDCTAHCVRRQVVERRNDDGCCPEGADWAADHDCASRCGNGVLEPGETCDPAAACVQPGMCTSRDACVIRRFMGEPTLCTARCEELRMRSCRSGDGCCPAGCNRATDADCVTSPGASVPSQPPPVGCESTSTLVLAEPASVRSARKPERHASSRPRPLRPRARKWLTAPRARNAMRSGAIAVTRARLRATSTRRGRARARCDARQAAPPSTTAQLVGDVSTPLGRAVALIDCRQANCAAECGL